MTAQPFRYFREPGLYTRKSMKRIPWLWLLVSAAVGVALTIWLVDSMMPPLARDFPQGELKTTELNGNTIVSGPRFTMILNGKYSYQRENEKRTVRPYNRVENVLIPPSQTNLLVIHCFPIIELGFEDFGPEPGYKVTKETKTFTLYKCKIPYVHEGKETVVAFAKGNSYQMIFFMEDGDERLVDGLVEYLHVY